MNMQNLYTDLAKLLETDDRLFADGKILKNIVTEMAIKLDEGLIRLLMKNMQIKEHFFVKIEDVLVFDKDKFVKFVNNKEFLPNSFTTFKNNIGLMNNDEYLRDSDKVVLVWAYKDCVLEGGQDKEDVKRNEIFYNEILAPDEIDRLFEPKVFTNVKKIDEKGEHKVDKITDEDNLIIKGNNLLALHSLKKKYRGKIKLIYIDPPYNTENDGFRYNDTFNHSTWLTFMKNRLNIAKELLRDDGLMFVQIDNNEHAYLKVLLDEIFNRQNFINSIVWKRTFSHGDIGQGAKHLGRLHDIILLYSKTQSFKLNPVYTLYSDKYVNDFYKYEDEGGKYRLVSLLGPGGASKGNPFYEFLGVEKYWVYSKKKMMELYKQGKIIQVKKGTVPQKKRYLNESPGVPLQDLWLDINALQGSSKEKMNFSGQKPEQLLSRIMQLATDPGDIVLDYHLGTGTTCSVAHKMGRRYIGVEQMDYGNVDSLFRLTKVVKGDDAGISREVHWKGGGSFIYMELKQWNEQYVQSIRDAKDSKALLAIHEKMEKEAFFRYEVNLSKFDNRKFADLSIDEQKQLLIECLDKNHLYVNYSEMDDATYKISIEEKQINKHFYGK